MGNSKRLAVVLTDTDPPCYFLYDVVPRPTRVELLMEADPPIDEHTKQAMRDDAQSRLRHFGLKDTKPFGLQTVYDCDDLVYMRAKDYIR